MENSASRKSAAPSSSGSYCSCTGALHGGSCEAHLTGQVVVSAGGSQQDGFYNPPKGIEQYANRAYVVPKDAVALTGYPFHWVKKDGSTEPIDAYEEPQHCTGEEAENILPSRY